MSYDAEVLADAPLSYWKLDETSGTVAVDTMGAHDGTYVGGPTLGQPGIRGETAVKFDQSVAPQFAEFGEVYGFGEQAAFCVECWVMFNDPWAGTVSVIGNVDPNALAGWLMELIDISEVGGWGAQFTREDGVNALGVGIFEADKLVFFGQQMHIVASYDGAGNQAFYSNAVLADSRANDTLVIPTPTHELWVGGYEGVTPGPIVTLSKVAIYDHALSPERIAAHYAAGIAVDAPAARAGLIHARRDGHGIGS